MLFVRGCGVAPFAGGGLLGAAGRVSPASLPGNDASLGAFVTGPELAAGAPRRGGDSLSAGRADGGVLEAQPPSTNSQQPATDER
jgi:hypothetical protein